jgi:predicted HTH domain antitoxin
MTKKEIAMQEQIINISFPVNANILLSLKESKDEFIRDVLFSTALLFYRKGKLSLGKAAELAGYDKIGFIDKLRHEGEPVFDYAADEIDEIFADAKNL